MIIDLPLIVFNNNHSFTGSDRFVCTIRLNSIHSTVTFKMFEKYDTSYRHKQMVASFPISARFTAKFEWVFALTQQVVFLRGFILKPTEKIFFLKHGSKDF